VLEAGTKRASVVGYSLGGAVGLKLAIEHPERVASLTVIAFTSDHAGELPAAKKWLLYNVLCTQWLVTALTPVFWALAMAAYARTNSLRVPRSVVRWVPPSRLMPTDL
jgi:pimeloyl-ACP methyl ester carboxylesterase